VNIQCIIPGFGGSQGIFKKNIINFCGKPLLAWTIDQCINAEKVSDVWVSSDDDDILNIAAQYGAKIIKRPSLHLCIDLLSKPIKAFHKN
jgi:CMP-N-acetylneuraminic acid synthetase